MGPWPPRVPRIPWAQHYDATETQVAVIREALSGGPAMDVRWTWTKPYSEMAIY